MQSRLETVRAYVLAETKELRRLNAEDSVQVTSAQRVLRALLAERMNRSARPASSGARAPPTNGDPTSAAKSAAVSPSPELRRMHVQALVSEQRLRFAALLKRLGFTAEKLQDFDRIQGAWQEALLDDAQNATARKQAVLTRDARLKELFGAANEQWIEANRSEPARAVVGQVVIVQQMFQGSGALTTAQADELARIVAQHRIPASRELGAGPPRYAWDRIGAAARTILADRQQDDFIAAVEYRRTADRMSARAARRKQ